MLINQKATRIPSMKESAMLEGNSRNIMQSMSSPRILNTHLLFCDIPRDFVEKKCKIIYILRNPKDVAVSFYNHHVRLLDYEYSGTWRSYLPRFLSGRGEWMCEWLTASFLTSRGTCFASVILRVTRIYDILQGKLKNKYPVLNTSLIWDSLALFVLVFINIPWSIFKTAWC